MINWVAIFTFAKAFVQLNSKLPLEVFAFVCKSSVQLALSVPGIKKKKKKSRKITYSEIPKVGFFPLLVNGSQACNSKQSHN